MLLIPERRRDGNIDMRNISERVLETPLRWIGEERITRSPFVWGGGPAKDKASRGKGRLDRMPKDAQPFSPGVEQDAKSIPYAERNVVNPNWSRVAVGR